MTVDEVKTWAQSQVYESPDQMSRIIFKEVLPNIDTNLSFIFGHNQETGNYDITYDGIVISIHPAD